MSHRALVAVTRRDGSFDVHLAREGATDELLDELLSPDATLPAGIMSGPARARAEDLDEVLDAHLDPMVHEALLLVSHDGTVIPHVVIPGVLATADGLVEGEPAGLILALVGRDGSVLKPPYVRGWFHGTGGVLGEAVDAGFVSSAEAFGWLRDAVERLAGDEHDLAVVSPGR